MGDAKVLYPKLLEYIEEMDNLTEHAIKNGSISLGDSNGIKALEDAGFTITIP